MKTKSAALSKSMGLLRRFAPRKSFVLIIIALAACAGKPEPDHQKSSAPVDSNQISRTDTVINFEAMESGKPPLGFTQTYTGKKQTIDWQIVTDNGNKVAAQLAKNKGNYFNLLVLDSPAYENFTLSVKIKAIGGEEDQGGGLVWRYVDNNNYYIARYNPLEKNFRLYHVVEGKREQLKSVGGNIGSGEWFTFAIAMKGNAITCSLNGTKMIDAADDTFSKAGRVGLWSKADAQSYFDDLTIVPIK